MLSSGKTTVSDRQKIRVRVRVSSRVRVAVRFGSLSGKSSESVQCAMLKTCDACADMDQL